MELDLRDPDTLDIDQALIDQQVDLVFIPSGFSPSRAVSYRRFSVMDWIYVAGRDHPLARLRGQLTEADLLNHTQLLPTAGPVISEAMRDGMRLCPSVISCERFVQIRQLLELNLGFALLPRYAVGALVEAGQLAVLDCEMANPEHTYWDVEVRWTTLGPAGQWLLDRVSGDA